MITKRQAITGVAVLGVVLGAWYSFRMLQYVLFGSGDKSRTKGRTLSSSEKVTTDLPIEHKAVFGSLALLCLFIGVMPNLAIALFKSDVDSIAHVYDKPAATARLSAQRLIISQPLVQTASLGLKVEE
jgi:NADH:ubiquinone oxidoreductase subunit 4 (subunit M)